MTSVSPDNINLLMKELSKWPPLPMDEQRDLFIAMKKGDSTARGKLILSNVRLAISVVARRFPTYKQHLHKARFGDMVGFSILGLITAVDKFRHEEGVTFSTYAMWWIRHSIQRGLRGKMFDTYARLPEHVSTALNALIKLRKQGKGTTTEELEKAAKITSQMAERIYRIADDGGLESVASLQSDGWMANEDKPVPLMDRFEDMNFRELEAKIMAGITVQSLLKKLTPRARDILMRHFVRGDTLQEIGKLYGLSRERVRQICVESMQRLRRIVEKEGEV